MSYKRTWSPARLRERREELGFSVRQVGSIVGRHHATVQRWEGGLDEPSAAMVGRLADLYRCSTDELYEWAET